MSKPSYELFIKLCEGKGVSGYKLSKDTQIPASTFTKWKNGTSFPKKEKIEKLSKYFNVREQDFYVDGQQEEAIPNYPEIFSVQKKEVPLLGKIACGEPILTEETFEGYMQCGSKHHVDFCLRASGDSMINARIYDGDIVFIRQQPEVENGEIAAVAIDNAVTLKRVYIEEDCIILRAENPRIKPMRFKKEDFDQFKILGKAVVFQGDVI